MACLCPLPLGALWVGLNNDSGHRQVSLLLGLLAVGDETPSAVVRTANMALRLRNSGTQSDGRWTPGPPKFPEADCSLSKVLPSSRWDSSLRPPSNLLSLCSPLAQRIPGTGEPDGLLSMGSQRVGHDWSDLAAAAAQRTLGWSGLVRFSSSLFPMCFYGKVNSSCFRAFPFDSQGPFLLSTKTGALQIKGFGFQKYCFSCGLQEPILNVRKLNFDCFILTLSLHIPVLPILILLEAIPLIF